MRAGIIALCVLATAVLGTSLVTPTASAEDLNCTNWSGDPGDTDWYHGQSCTVSGWGIACSTTTHDHYNDPSAKSYTSTDRSCLIAVE